MKKFPLQVAGHDLLLVSPDGKYVYKPATKKEIEFYEQAQQYREFNRFIPEFKGITSSALELENICYLMEDSIICDIKIGRILYDDDADDEKRTRMTKLSFSTTSHSLGFRFTGILHPDGTFYGKDFGKSLTACTISKGFDALFPHKNKDVISKVIRELQAMKDAISSVNVQLCSCSVLIVQQLDKVKVKLIDFAHSKFTELQSSNVDFIQGLESLIENMKEIE